MWFGGDVRISLEIMRLPRRERKRSKVYRTQAAWIKSSETHSLSSAIKCATDAGRSMPGAVLCISAKPDNAGGVPSRSIPTWQLVYAGGPAGSISTWKTVYAGGLIVYEWEAPTQREVRLYIPRRRHGAWSMLGAAFRIPSKPDDAGGDHQHLRLRVSRSVQETSLCVNGKSRHSGKARGHDWLGTWRPVHAGCHIVYTF